MTYDIAIIGGGIVGLATAFHLSQHHPGKSLIVVEKEAELATHQTGRNSGVLHSGIYYRPGSLKAENCRKGRAEMVAFCEREKVPFDLCGKVIVAVEEDERSRLHDIYDRGQQNGVTCTLIGPERLQALEPHAQGVEAIHVPDAGIVDYVGVCKALARSILERGHTIQTSAEVVGMYVGTSQVRLETTQGSIEAKYMVNCGGLYADRIAEMSGTKPGIQIVPFRGEYYVLKPEAQYLCNNLIYPVPDPAYPFLGVHFTRMIDGSVECGPSAVLAFAREGYTFGTVDFGELVEALRYAGFRKLARKHWSKGVREMRLSLSKKHYLRTLQRLVPAITLQDIDEAPSGVRAQALYPNGDLVDDFLFEETERVVNVCNAASPAATAALNIGRLIGERLAQRF